MACVDISAAWRPDVRIDATGIFTSAHSAMVSAPASTRGAGGAGIVFFGAGNGRDAHGGGTQRRYYQSVYLHLDGTSTGSTEISWKYESQPG